MGETNQAKMMTVLIDSLHRHRQSSPLYGLRGKVREKHLQHSHKNHYIMTITTLLKYYHEHDMKTKRY